MAQLPGACSCLRQHLVAEGQQVPGDPGGGIRQKRQQVDLSVPKIMPLIRLSGEAFRRHTRVFRARRGLQDVKEIEANRLLDLHGAALCAIFPDILDWTSLRRQKSSWYCSCEASSCSNPWFMTRSSVHSARPQSSSAEAVWEV